MTQQNQQAGIKRRHESVSCFIPQKPLRIYLNSETLLYKHINQKSALYAVIVASKNSPQRQRMDFMLTR